MGRLRAKNFFKIVIIGGLLLGVGPVQGSDEIFEEMSSIGSRITILRNKVVGAEIDQTRLEANDILRAVEDLYDQLKDDQNRLSFDEREKAFHFLRKSLKIAERQFIELGLDDFEQIRAN